MRIKVYNNRFKVYNTRAKYRYPNESKAYVDVIQADVALTADQRLYAHFMIGIDINELLWTLRKAYYLLLGGTASTHKWNAKDLRNLDAAFRLVFNGTVLHDANGINSQTGGYADTKLIPSSILTSINNVSLSIYITSNTTPALFADFGSTGSNTNTQRFVIRAAYDNSSNKTASGAIGQSIPLSDSYSNISVTGKGFILASRQSSQINKIFVNGFLEGTTTVVNTGTFPSNSMFLLGYNENGLNTLPSKRSLGVASVIDSGLTDQQAITDSFKTIFGQKIISRA